MDTQGFCTILIGASRIEVPFAGTAESERDRFDRAVVLAENMLRLRASTRNVVAMGYAATRRPETDAIIVAHDGDEWEHWALAHIRAV
jgi:hypothetical protein